MNKIEANDPAAQSADIVTDNLSQLQSLFPEAFSEGKIQFDTLRQLLGGTVDEADEKYGLNWHGKRRARQIALTPSTGTLRPCPDESVDWATTQNLMIEGDNLEVLKLLQKSYAGKVKLIYIDPPYNTGKDFVYPDNFRDSIGNYLELTGQVEGGAKMSANTDASGRFHTDWLNMIYPRLRLARSLLRDDGLIIVSIDSSEASNLRSLMDEIFGGENCIGLLPTIMNLKGNNDAFAFSDTHEFTVVYAKSRDACLVNELPVGEESLDDWDEDSRGLFKRADTLRRTGQDASRERRPNGWFPVFITPENEIYVTEDDRPRSTVDTVLWPKNEAGEELSWTWSKRKIIDEPFNLVVVDGRSGKNIYKKQRPGLGDLPTSKPKSILYKPEYSSSNGTAEMAELFGSKVFDSPPKPRSLIRDFVILGSSPDSIVLDFFAGTGTAGHTVFAQNAVDNGTRRFILVQLPAPCANDSEAYRAGYKTIAEITKERLRRAAKKVKRENPMFSGDLGFRVFKLDKSNIREWTPDPLNLAQTLLDHHEHILDDRTEADIVFELLLKLGLDLSTPMESRTVAGKSVGAVGGGVLMLCLAEKISAKEVETVAAGIVSWHKELAPAGDSTVVFRDSAFADDVAKTNMAAILAQNGLENVRSL
jgi:adenine-specific DNA-methyltransferase